MDEENIDERESMKEKRGTTLQVLAILSWIFVGINTLLLLSNMAGGPMTEEELTVQKAEVLEAYDEETLELMGDVVEDTIVILERSNEHFYAIQLSSLAIYALGFLAVFWMYQLKKKGFYLYILYTILPMVTVFVFYSGTFWVSIGIGFHAILGGLFCILYGNQLKRME